MEVKATLGRAVEIGLRIGGFILWMLLWRLGFARRQSPAERFADLLENLGTSFVKLGQHLSLRSDLFPPDFLAELQKLQDDVRPFPTSEAVAAIEAAFGKPPNQLFGRIDEAPLAAASVAQVHTARTFAGHEVVVKVLRPGVALQVDRDMRMFTAIVRFLSHFSGVLHRYRAEEVVLASQNRVERATLHEVLHRLVIVERAVSGDAAKGRARYAGCERSITITFASRLTRVLHVASQEKRFGGRVRRESLLTQQRLAQSGNDQRTRDRPARRLYAGR